MKVFSGIFGSIKSDKYIIIFSTIQFWYFSSLFNWLLFATKKTLPHYLQFRNCSFKKKFSDMNNFHLSGIFVETFCGNLEVAFTWSDLRQRQRQSPATSS